MTNREKCTELLSHFTEAQLEGVSDILEVLLKKAVSVPDHELLTLPDGYSVMKRANEILESQGKTFATELDTLCCFIVVNKGLPWEEPADLPNATTLAAMAEVARMEADPTLGKAYTDVDEMFKEILS